MTAPDLRTAPSARTRRLADDDHAYLWHPFTQMEEYCKDEPLIVERAEGCWLIDTEGRRYLDGVSSLWVTVHGHRHPRLDAALREQIDRVAHSTLLGVTNVPAIELARRLVEIAPEGLTRVFYAENGASAVEIALKMAFQYWQHRGQPQRTRFLRLENAYHGDTIGAVSVGGIDRFHAAYGPLLFPTYEAPSPDCYRSPLAETSDDLATVFADALGDVLAAHHEEIAAVIVEPLVQAAAGMITAPEGYLRLVREHCDRFSVPLIVDEVATGFGRTGRMFACEHEGISPDFLVLGKGITGGYLPLSAVLTTDEIYDAFFGPYESFKTLFHGHTYTGNPLACAVALANLDVFEEEQTLERLQPKIAHLTRRLDAFGALEHVGDVRQRGFMVGIELVADRATKAPYPVEAQLGWRVIRLARERGVVIRPLGDVIVLMPPLSITIDELDLLLDVTYDCIRKATEQ
ncbi:MAG: adenosylmethionine--8-amino-7-oxononanoate transaminase [Dehalococcoidia bacterium]